MTVARDPERSSAKIAVLPAGREQEPIVANLLELYAHDFSEFHNIELGQNGRFGYQHLPLYWREPNRHPFLIKVDGKLAGLALVKQGSEVSHDANVWDMAEFFIVRGYRRRGIGTGAAHEVWRRFPGRWEVRVMASNQAAQYFWEQAAVTFTGEPVTCVEAERNGKCWRVISFESRHTG